MNLSTLLCGFLFTALCSLSLSSAAQTAITAHSPNADGPSPWTSLEALDADAQFHFIVVTDRTGGARGSVWQQAMAKVNLMQPAFVVSVGDLIQGGTEDLEQLEMEWSELIGFVGELESPFFYTAGNHDISNDVMANVWDEKFGISYYGFRYKDALFLVLNSIFFNNPEVPDDWVNARQAQMRWLSETLAENNDVRWTYLFMHYPFWRDYWWRQVDSETQWTGIQGWSDDSVGPETWQAIENMLADRDYTAFAGHTHTYEYEAEVEAGHTHERISLATTGGGATIRWGEERSREPAGVDFAEFDHFVWVTMTEDGPVIVNIALDDLLPKDFDHLFK